MRKQLQLLDSACLFIALLFIFTLGGCGSDSETRLETRATIEGLVLLEDVEGLNDASRVNIDIGQGEGGVAPEEDGSFRFADLEPDLYSLVITYSGGLTEGAEGSAYRRNDPSLSSANGTIQNTDNTRFFKSPVLFLVKLFYTIHRSFGSHFHRCRVEK